MPSTTTTIVSVLAASSLAYLAYFDYRRRNSVEFRKELRRNSKKYAKAQEELVTAEKVKTVGDIRSVLTNSLVKNPLPTDMESKQEHFLAELSQGENAQKANDPIGAALGFYRALCLFPNPTELLGIYEKNLTKDILDVLVSMIAIEPPQSLLSAFGGAAAPAAEDAEATLD
ncbi:protein import receptor MAS20 [Nadsonia fulvescens var. elongata DSM 6958]|uniref:Protein import receptor MAS20 n=1 Tax=Nadsonia fulvescens var. elongata DSM 6958 TaxID=857566 RepID=A0A1E3PKY6_9ASCO|nr:protein import receptor MAS20 [Nadsonia fulvescens var. elongata DSM 6958]